jgi:hypothetical protein
LARRRSDPKRELLLFQTTTSARFATRASKMAKDWEATCPESTKDKARATYEKFSSKRQGCSTGSCSGVPSICMIRSMASSVKPTPPIWIDYSSKNVSKRSIDIWSNKWASQKIIL